MLAPRLTRGSSPLARGLQVFDNEELPGTGIIPARAGFTIKTRYLRRASEDHPRSRGVYKAWGGDTLLNTGSSPLARGLREGY